MKHNSWDYAPVSRVAKIYLGGTPSRSILEYWGGEIKWASAKDIASSNARYIFDAEETITQAGLNNSAAKLMNRDTIVITARGTVGAIRMLGKPMSFNQTCYGLVAKDNIEPTFLFYALKAGIEDIKSLSYGTIFDTITTKTFESLLVPLPPLPEQRAIAEILGALDDKIELNRRMNGTLESMARAVFGERMKDENGRMKGWEEKSLDEIANFLNGLALQKFPAEGDDYLPVIKISQLRKNDTEGADKASTNIPPEYIIEDGDILFSWSGSLEVVVWCGGKGALNQHLFKVTSEQYPKWFYYFWTKHHLPDFQEIAAGKATTMGHIQRHHLKAAKVLVPSDKELQEMNKVMSPLLDKIIVNNLESRTLASLRDGLLSRLMRGEVRVVAQDVENHRSF